MSRTLVFGDIHGCFAELEALLEKLQPTTKDRLIFLGDLVDKGPQSAAVVKLVRSLSDEMHNVILIQGNHEEKHSRWWHHVSCGNGRERKLKGHEEILGIQKDLSDADRYFLFSESKLFYSFHSVSSLAVHGGIPKELATLPLVYSATYTPDKATRKTWDRILRLRYVDADTGAFVASDMKNPKAVLWPTHYDNRFGTIYYGHIAYVKSQAPVVSNDTVGLDLGCVFGNVLCAQILHEDGRAEYVTVPARRQYAEIWDD